MLSVHGHCHSWSARASELRAGRWVQGPAEFEPTNLETPPRPPPPPPTPFLRSCSGFKFFGYVMCAEQVAALWSKSFSILSQAFKKKKQKKNPATTGGNNSELKEIKV